MKKERGVNLLLFLLGSIFVTLSMLSSCYAAILFDKTVYSGDDILVNENTFYVFGFDEDSNTRTINYTKIIVKASGYYNSTIGINIGNCAYDDYYAYCFTDSYYDYQDDRLIDEQGDMRPAIKLKIINDVPLLVISTISNRFVTSSLNNPFQLTTKIKNYGSISANITCIEQLPKGILLLNYTDSLLNNKLTSKFNLDSKKEKIISYSFKSLDTQPKQWKINCTYQYKGSNNSIFIKSISSQERIFEFTETNSFSENTSNPVNFSNPLSNVSNTSQQRQGIINNTNHTYTNQTISNNLSQNENNSEIAEPKKDFISRILSSLNDFINGLFGIKK